MRLRDFMTRAGSAVVVSGIGLATALGATRETTWTAIRAGRSGARALSLEPDSRGRPALGFPSLLAETIRREDRPIEPALALLANLTAEALADAGLSRGPGPTHYDPNRAAVLVGLSKGSIRSLARLHRTLHEPGAAEALWPMCWPSAGAELVARESGFTGPRLAPIAACATGLVAVLQGADLLRRGACDVVLAGSADASLEPFVLAAFRRMRVLAHAADPARAVRPWDRARSGFLVGEGGALLVLERAEAVRARGAVPYAEIAGGALGADAHPATDLNPDPAGLADVIQNALSQARARPEEIDHVNVHGTATRVNDPTECRALRLALGKAADRVACSANKSQIGHLLGAAGAAELAIACLSLRDGFLPPTLNLTDPAPNCDLDATPLVGRSRSIAAALKLSIGFGGHLAVTVLRNM